MAEWIEVYTHIKCPHCGAEFSDEIYFMPAYPNWHYPHFCPDCGKAVKAPDSAK